MLAKEFSRWAYIVHSNTLEPLVFSFSILMSPAAFLPPTPPGPGPFLSKASKTFKKEKERKENTDVQILCYV